MKEAYRIAIEKMRGVDLPEMPQEIAELDFELNRPLVNLATVARIIEKNTTLAGDVLRIIKERNIQAEGNDVEINSIFEAVNFIGLDIIRNVILTAAFERAKGREFLYNQIIEQSIDVAFCMAELSGFVAETKPGEAFILGLMHNAGSLVLAEKHPAGYEKLYNRSFIHPVEVLALEDERYQTNHAMIGVVLGRIWGLGHEMLSAIKLHHIERCDSIKHDKVRAYVAMLRVSMAIVSEINGSSYRTEQMKSFEKDGQEELMLSYDTITEVRQALLTSGDF